MAPTTRISPIYSLLFLTIEPLTALGGFIAAYFYPSYYLNETYPASPFHFLPDRFPPSIDIVLQQLANLYFLFAFNEALVLRAAAKMGNNSPAWYHIFEMEWHVVDLKVWRMLLGLLLVADVGHLWSVRRLGVEIYWDVGAWNAMAWGNIGIVYVGALARICFLLGLGVQRDGEVANKKVR